MGARTSKIRISASKLRDYDICPRMYKFRYLDKLPTKVRPELFLGEHVHTAIKLFFALVDEERTEAKLADVFRRVWAVDRRRRAVFPSRVEERKYGQEGLLMLSTFYRLYGHKIPASIELFKEHLLTDSIILVGRIDRIDILESGKLVITDFKTGKMPDFDGQPRADIQAIAYQVIAEGCMEREVERVDYLYLRTGQVFSFKLSHDELSEAKEWMISTAHRIASDRSFLGKPGPLCTYCDYLDHCPDV